MKIIIYHYVCCFWAHFITPLSLARGIVGPAATEAGISRLNNGHFFVPRAAASPVTDYNLLAVGVFVVLLWGPHMTGADDARGHTPAWLSRS